MTEQATLLNPSNNEPAKTRWGPALLSGVSHFLLLAILFLLISRIRPTTRGEPDRVGEIVLAIVDDNLETHYFQNPDDSTNPEAPPPATAIATDPPPVVEFQLPEPSSLPGPVPSQFSDQASDMTAGATSRTPETYELTDDDLEMIAAEQKLIRDRRPKGSETTINVFGSGDLTGRKFVFLIDRSKSMGDQGLGVLKQARIELSQAINALQEHHSFQVVVYHNSTGTIGRRELLLATPENKERVPVFLQSLMAFGGTNHELGLYSAMAFDPDIIVVMTDGGAPKLNDGQLNTITKTARNTQIHTIQFGLGAARESNHFLERLSMKTSGTYRYVDVRSWRTKQP